MALKLLTLNKQTLNIMKRFSLILASLLIIVGISAQENVEVKSSRRVSTPHEIGFAAGFATGYGLSYRYWPKLVGVQFTAFPFVSDDESYISLGLTGLFELDSHDWYRFFGFVGTHLNIQEYDEEIYSSGFDLSNGYYSNLVETNRVEKKKYIIGIGPGIEFTPGGRIGINIMTGFQFQYVDKNDWGTYPTIESGIYFRF
jgi:hypothetical protein